MSIASTGCVRLIRTDSGQYQVIVASTVVHAGTDYDAANRCYMLESIRDASLEFFGF